MRAIAVVLALLVSTPALAKPGPGLDVKLSAAPAAAGKREVTVEVRASRAGRLGVEVVTSGAVELARRAPEAIEVRAGERKKLRFEVKQRPDEEARVLVRVSSARGAREASLDLAPEVTARRRAAPAPVDRTADGQPVMR